MSVSIFFNMWLNALNKVAHSIIFNCLSYFIPIPNLLKLKTYFIIKKTFIITNLTSKIVLLLSSLQYLRLNNSYNIHIIILGTRIINLLYHIWLRYLRLKRPQKNLNATLYDFYDFHSRTNFIVRKRILLPPNKC